MRSFWFGMIALLTACSGSPYPGFTETEDGVHVRLHTLGDGVELASDSDSVHVRLRIAHWGDAPGTLYSTERTYATRTIRKAMMREALGRMHAGDSMSLIVPADQVPWSDLRLDVAPIPADTGTVQVELGLLAIITPQMMRDATAEAKRNDPEGYERRLIKAYLASSAQPWTQWGSSEMHYFVEVAPSDTNAVKQGALVSVSYEGRRLEDGVMVDDTERQGGAFSWRYGDPDQVMQGMEIAVQLLREGGVGQFILPSAYAFGARGVPGVVDPYTPVLYRVSVVRVGR